jgi:hypothetical protein
MKLLVCDGCQTAQVLTFVWASCDCGLVGGQYRRDGDRAVVAGPMRLFGLSNHTFWPQDYEPRPVVAPYPLDNGKVAWVEKNPAEMRTVQSYGFKVASLIMSQTLNKFPALTRPQWAALPMHSYTVSDLTMIQDEVDPTIVINLLLRPRWPLAYVAVVDEKPYLLDGHHRGMAAHLLKKPLLAFTWVGTCKSLGKAR